jgi:hypothetical protein
MLHKAFTNYRVVLEAMAAPMAATSGEAPALASAVEEAAAPAQPPSAIPRRTPAAHTAAWPRAPQLAEITKEEGCHLVPLRRHVPYRVP